MLGYCCFYGVYHFMVRFFITFLYNICLEFKEVLKDFNR